MTMRAVVIICLIVTFDGACSAHPPPQPDSPLPQAPAPSPPPRPDTPLKQVGRARAYYDARRSQTVALANGWVVGKVSGKDSPDSIELMVDFSVPGAALSAPQAVRLTFEAYVKQPVFTDAHTLTIIADGKTIFEGEAKLVRSDCSESPCDEIVRGPLVPLPILEQLVSAGSVQFRLGNKSYDLGKDAWEALRDIAELARG
jgi:hypothetical protein